MYVYVCVYRVCFVVFVYMEQTKDKMNDINGYVIFFFLYTTKYVILE